MKEPCDGINSPNDLDPVQKLRVSVLYESQRIIKCGGIMDAAAAADPVAKYLAARAVLRQTVEYGVLTNVDGEFEALQKTLSPKIINLVDLTDDQRKKCDKARNYVIAAYNIVKG